MKLQLDNSVTYAVALEGGGAKGAYEIGVWQALEEAGIRYNAVSGTSVGALNGSLMAMRDLPRAIEAWSDMRLSKVFDIDEELEDEAGRLMKGGFDLEDLYQLLPKARDVIKNRGLDVAPLRAWVREVVDEHKVKTSDVELYVCTVDLTDRKGLEVHVNGLPESEICDMLLASAYHPSFRLEKLGGKYYTDGGFFDSIPIHVLIENGYKNIIAVRMPGIGIERRVKIPEDVKVTTISTTANLGFVLNFDAEQAKQNMAVGYLDAKRVLYGLRGREYYIDRTMTEPEALEKLKEWNIGRSESLRSFYEKDIPRLAKHLDFPEGDYYDIMVTQLEALSGEKGLDVMRIYTDRELIEAMENSVTEAQP